MKLIHAADRPFVPASHEDPLSPGVWKKVLLQGDDFRPGRVQMINWARLPAGRSFAPHYHEDMQELFVIIQGSVELAVGCEKVALGRGDALLIDSRETHQMSNSGSEDAEYLVVGVSAGTGGKTVLVPSPADGGSPQKR